MRFEHLIAAVYVVMGSLWILFSDKILEKFVEDKALFNQLQTVKGWLYVMVTGIIFFIFLKRHLKKLREVEQKAIESDKLKSAFLANVSHEIRTPMNGILGFAQLLKNPTLTGDEQKEYIKIIGESSDRMLLLLNDLVTISNIQAGNLTVLNSKIDIPALLSFLSSVYKPQALFKGIKISQKFQSSSGESVICSDKEKLVSVLSRLINNALKFTNKGEIEFGCLIERERANFFVNDSGIGISQKSLERIFERFTQASNHSSKGYEGIGLGLSISKDYIDIMGGTISVKSTENIGTEFEFSIPLNNSLDNYCNIISTDFISIFDN